MHSAHSLLYVKVTRRKLITWIRRAGQRTLNEVMEAAVRVSAGTGIRLKEKGEAKHHIRRWAFIDGDRSTGRFTVASSADQSGSQYRGKRILVTIVWPVLHFMN